MNKVLFLCYYFPPMGMGGTQRSAKFVKYLPAYSWHPIVVTVKQVKYYAQDLTLLEELRYSKIFRTESLDPLRLLARVRSSKPKTEENNSANGSSAILNLLNKVVNYFLIPDSKILWLPFALFASVKLIHKYRIKIIFTSSPPQSAHLGGLLLQWISGVKWVADFRDDWTGGESQPSPTVFHSFVNKLLEKFVIKFSDRIIAMCDPLTENLRKKAGYCFQTDKFITLTNGYDADDFSELLSQELHSKFTITHAGSISKVSNPECFLKAIHSLFEQKPHLQNQIQIQFFGTDIFGNLAHLIKKYNLSNIIPSLKYLPHRDVLKEVMKSHLLLLVINKRTNEEILTSKVFEYLGAGKPILLISTDGEAARLIRKLNRGTVLKNNDIGGIKKTIIDYYSLYQQGNLKFSQPLSLRQFDRKILTGNLAETFSEMLKY